MFRIGNVLHRKVTVIGAKGGIGQPLSLLLKNSPLISHLSLYDVTCTKGIREDIDHICTKSKVTCSHGQEGIKDALIDSDIVVITAGVPRKPGMTRNDLFKINANIIYDVGCAIAKYSPKSHICIISNPVNSLVPVMSQVLKTYGVYDRTKLYGITTLDIVRAKTFIGTFLGLDPSTIKVDVVGGHAGETIVPVLGPLLIPHHEASQIIHDIQFGGDKVVKAKDGAGSATLSMAWSGAHFTLRLIEALNGVEGIKECCYIDQEVEGCKFFSSLVRLGKEGIVSSVSLSKMGLDDEDYKRVRKMTTDLKSQIDLGLSFTKETESKL